MDCTTCKSEMANLFEHGLDKAATAQVMKHIQQCNDCYIEYRKTEKVFSMLKPRFRPNAPSALKQNILQQLKKEKTKMKAENKKPAKSRSLYTKIISAAAILALVLLVIPMVDKNQNTAKAASIVFENSIQATKFIKSMIMKLKVRTAAHDNFSLVGTEYQMIDHTIWKSFEVPMKWKLDKGERVVMFDGKNQYLWLPQFEEALIADRDANITEWLSILLEPDKLLLKEQESSLAKGSKITLAEKNDELLMTITSSAQGNFINDYCKNKSIEESDNRREYVFDVKSKLLKGLRIYIIEQNKETLIMETSSIDYNVDIAASTYTINLPSGVEWQNINNNLQSKTFQNITSKRAVELFLAGMANNDWKLVEETCDFFTNKSKATNEIKEQFSGLSIIKIGEPFKSGLYPGEFVPCEIRLKSGEIEHLKLALRNDNPNKVWVVDGGF
jgi:outer membrane lipoprotein-sorting protein